MYVYIAYLYYISITGAMTSRRPAGRQRGSANGSLRPRICIYYMWICDYIICILYITYYIILYYIILYYIILYYIICILFIICYYIIYYMLERHYVTLYDSISYVMLCSIILFKLGRSGRQRFAHAVTFACFLWGFGYNFTKYNFNFNKTFNELNIY